MSDVEVVEYTDPCCSWAWGSEGKLRRLRWRFEDRVTWRRVMGGLVPDRGPDFDPERPVAKAAEMWEKVGAITGMPAPSHLKRVPRSSQEMGLAVKAAELQSEAVAQLLLRRLRESIFFDGEPADTLERILALVPAVPGLDGGRFADDTRSDVAAKAFREDFEETRRPNDYVRTLGDTSTGNGSVKNSDGRDRYTFPTIIVRGPAGEATAPGWQAYERYEECLETASPGITADPRPVPTPHEVLARWPTAVPAEIAILTSS